MPLSVAPATLLVSNGHAEDLISAALARELRRRLPEVPVLALPLVGYFFLGDFFSATATLTS